jgi:hypothetical protein
METQRRLTMLTSRLTRLGALALVSAASAASRGPLLAQATPRTQETVQLAFGYECDDRFLVRNDGAQPVTVEYGITGAAQRSALYLKGKDAVELSSSSNEPLELWVSGKLVATERKGNVPCASSEPGPVVVVRPIEPREYVTYVEPAYYYPPPVVYVRPAPVFVYRRPSISVVLPFFTHFGGFGPVVRIGGHGPGVQSGGHGRVVQGRGYVPRAQGGGRGGHRR